MLCQKESAGSVFGVFCNLVCLFSSGGWEAFFIICRQTGWKSIIIAVVIIITIIIVVIFFAVTIIIIYLLCKMSHIGSS